ncbi:hypothetical protein B0H14DRAFT_2540801 [Mycena olivaceomarginata]|nr:hypothetical protein B0H14DRAFT_2540801 [Mycena olivaceomarginata]
MLSSFFGKRPEYATPTVPRIPKLTASGPSYHSRALPRSLQAGPVLKSVPLPPTESSFLVRFRRSIEQLAGHVPVADEEHPFARFRNYEGSIADDAEPWEVWDRKIGNQLPLSQEQLRPLIMSGPNGVQAMYDVMFWLSTTHKVDIGVMEPKIDRVMEAIHLPTSTPTTSLPPSFTRASSVIDVDDTEFRPPSPRPAHPPTSSSPSSSVRASSIIDVDSIHSRAPSPQPASPRHARCKPMYSCAGVKVEFPHGVSAWEGYTNGLHTRLNDPWDAVIRRGEMRIFSRSCEKDVDNNDETCICCEDITASAHFKTVQHHILDPPKAKTNLAYYSTNGLVQKIREGQRSVRALRLVRVNDGKKIASRTRALALHKQWVAAVASGKVLRVDRLAATHLNHKVGIAGLMKHWFNASKHIYKPLNYTQEDYLRGLLIWRLGGARLAGIAHRALDLPSVSTLRRHSIVPNLVTSSTHPKPAEIEANLRASFKEIEERIGTEGVVHQILMVDELKVEERLRWDPNTNVVLGLCREHSAGLSLEFVSENEPKLILNELRANKTHLAVEATVASVGLLAKDPALYSARTGLISGSCKRESGESHAKILKTALESSAITKLRTVNLTSDGESRRAEAIIRLTFKYSLPPSSPIHPLLHDLEFMNLMVGEDDLTGDKDYKHCFKRLRNWLLRKRGLVIGDLEITMAIVRSQLQFHGLTPVRIGNLLQPNDRQDVKLAYDLLREIWRLPTLNSDSGKPLRFIETRETFQMLGSLFRHLIFPYVCTTLSLSDQLRHLSSAAHLLLALMRKTNAGAKFMPTQLYIDLMMMIKNVFFCVAKTQVDCPAGEFWLILLGTDRLEVLFGILRTMVGSDANVDLLQLALRITGTTEVSTILALFPHWDSAPRRLKLPVLSENDIEIEQRQDHITPPSWTGNVAVKNVNLRTLWILGRKDIEAEFPALAPVLKELSDERAAGESIDILQPFGTDIVHAERAADDIDDSAEDYQEAGTVPSVPDSVPPPEPFTEDAVAEDDPEQKYSPTFDLGGKEVYKGNQLFRDYKNPQAGSQDRLKRVANLPRYGSILCSVFKRNFTILRYMVQTDTTYSSVIRSDEDSTGAQITLDIPIVTFNDWIWEKGRGKTFTTPGRFTELIDPDINVAKGQSARLLFDSQDILAIGGMIFGRITAADGPKIASVPRSAHFPYQNTDGKLCFLCEDETVEHEIARIGCCAHCSPPVKLSSRIPDLLNHNAAHILFDPAIKAEDQPCGLCLRPAPQCTFVLKGSSSADIQVDGRKSNCPGYSRFSYQTASVSETKNPSSNVPVPCPISSCSAVIWRYGLLRHFKECHPGLPQSLYDTHAILATEKMLLKHLWNDRHSKKTAQVQKVETEEGHRARRIGLLQDKLGSPYQRRQRSRGGSNAGDKLRFSGESCRRARFV